MVACAVTETNCPLLTSLFFSLLSLSRGYFSARRGYRMVPKFCMGFSLTNKIRFWVKNNSGDPPCPRGYIFWKTQKVLRIAGNCEKIDQKCFQFFCPPPPKKKMGSKFFGGTTILWVNIFVGNHFLGSTFLGGKIFVGGSFLGPQHLLGVNICWESKHLGSQNFWGTTFWGVNNF